MRFDKKIWEEGDAKDYCDGKGGTFEAATGKEIEQKEGRVISEVNRSLIKNCITQMDEAVGALRELLSLTEPPAKSAEPSGDKGRIAGKAAKSKKNEDNETRLLKIADKVIEQLLLKRKYEKRS
jgi:hypothetical protein